MVSSQKQEIFETMPIPKALLKMSGPTIVSQLISLVYNIADTFYLGRTGNAYMVAAATVSFTVFMLTIAFSNLFGLGGGSQMARLLGAHKEENARNVCAFSFYGAVGIALLYSLVIGLFLNPVLYALGASADTIVYARQYVLLVIVIGSVPVVTSAVMAHLLRNVGMSSQASLGLGGAGILNIALDPLFMFVIFPDGMEVFGAALATLLSSVASMVYFIVVIQKASRTSSVSLDIRRIAKTEKSDITALFAVGIPSALLTAFVDVANMFTNVLASAYGDMEVAAIGIVMKVERLPTAVNLGISHGMLPIVAYNYSAKNYERMKKAITTGRLYGLIVAMVSIVLYELLATPVIRVFLSTKTGYAAQAETTLALAVLFLRLRAPHSLFKTLNFHSSYCLQAMGDGKLTLIHAFAREMLFHVPLMYLFNALFGVNGVACAIVAGELCGSVLALILLRHKLGKLS